MKAIKNFYTIISLIVLMILRPFSPGEWFGSVAIAGLFVTWVDTIQKVWKANNKLTLEQEAVSNVGKIISMLIPSSPKQNHKMIDTNYWIIYAKSRLMLICGL